MSNALRILHLEDNGNDAELVRIILEKDLVDVELDHVSTKKAFEKALQEGSYDIILSDFSMPEFDGLRALDFARQLKPEVPFLFLSGTIGEERAVESLRKGAVDYVLKDRVQRLSTAILRARKEALERAERSKNELQIRQQAELLNQAQDAIYVRNIDQYITYWNKASERIYGWNSSEVIGKRACELLYGSNPSRRDHIWDAVLEKGEWVGELTQITKAGKQIHVASRRTLLRDVHGAPLAILNINTDITEKKNLESQILRSQRVDCIGAMAGGIAHDLNNVLTPILLASGILQTQLTFPNDLRMVNVVKKNAQKGADLVKQILQFASGTKPPETELDFASLLSDLTNLSFKAFPGNVKIESEVQQGLFSVSGDRTQFHQILLNLCVNARDAMPGGGKLAIKISNTIFSDRVIQGQKRPVTGNFVELAVSDTGTGIPPEIAAHIFEPFFTTKSIDKGSGLGLSTVATIVRNHQGYLELETAIGRGTTFRVFLPAADGKRSDEKNNVFMNPAGCGQGQGILLINEEYALLEMTKELLEAHDYRVVTATGGFEALAQLERCQEKIAALIIDLPTPELNLGGWIDNIFKRLPNVTIICLKATDEAVHLRGEWKGRGAFLKTPCPPAELLGTLQRLLAFPPT
ncbi:MAG: hybrid sensor histidine kinase/response regulator [Verrucomicrobiales bacterium]|nr:hybrid sensor histidine kinase/response regulator [Verrucomicrobiales bacterium]